MIKLPCNQVHVFNTFSHTFPLLTLGLSVKSLVPNALSRELLGPNSFRFAQSVNQFNRFTEKIRIGRTVRSRFCVRGAPLRGPCCCCCLGRYAEAGRGKETQEEKAMQDSKTASMSWSQSKKPETGYYIRRSDAVLKQERAVSVWMQPRSLRSTSQLTLVM